MLDRYRQSGVRDFLDSTLFVDLNLYLPETLMTKNRYCRDDPLIRARMPLLDHKFLEFVARIPSGLKLKEGVLGKYILRRQLSHTFPTK